MQLLHVRLRRGAVAAAGFIFVTAVYRGNFTVSFCSDGTACMHSASSRHLARPQPPPGSERSSSDMQSDLSHFTFNCAGRDNASSTLRLSCVSVSTTADKLKNSSGRSCIACTVMQRVRYETWGMLQACKSLRGGISV